MFALALVLLACRSSAPEAPISETPPVQRPEPLPVWPDPSAAFIHPVIRVPEGFERQTVFVNAGHGNGGRHGNLGAWCTRESDFTLRASERLSDLLHATGHFDVVRSRTGDQRPSYGSRIRHLKRSGASTMIELHSDARASAMVPNAVASDGEICWRDDSEPGFTILVNDRASTEEAKERLALARAIAVSMAEVGFVPWVGDDYEGMYDRDDVDGVWRDRRGLYMLRHPEVPAVIIETHNGKDGRETLRWEDPATHDAFGRAVLVALFRWYEER
jgi:N-acetylmuramoyl-L-alanine amidase